MTPMYIEKLIQASLSVLVGMTLPRIAVRLPHWVIGRLTITPPYFIFGIAVSGVVANRPEYFAPQLQMCQWGTLSVPQDRMSFHFFGSIISNVMLSLGCSGV